MHKLTRLAVVAVIAALPCAALAAHRTPGLWEITTNMHFTKGGFQIPPQVMAQMKARGIKMPDFNAPHTFKECLTAAQAARDEHPAFSQRKDCTTRDAMWTGDHFHAEIACNAAGNISHGVIDGSIGDGGKSYSGSFRMEGDNARMGGHVVMEGHTSGKWLGPTCTKGAS